MATDLLTYLEQRMGVSRKVGDDHTFFCPFCMSRTGSESSNRKLYLDLAKGLGYCFRCDYKVRGWRRLLTDLNGGKLLHEDLQYLEQSPTVVRRGGETVQSTIRGILYREVPQAHELLPVPLPPSYVPLFPHNPNPMLRRAYRYLESRHADADACRKYRIGYALSGTYAGYLIFPVVMAGSVRYFTTRYAGASEFAPKSHNETGDDRHVGKSHVLFNYDNVVGEPVVSVTEGVFSCLAAEPAVALLGKVCSDTQFQLLLSLAALGTTEFIIALDPDAADKARELYRRLQGRVPKVSFLRLVDGDPYDCREDMPRLKAERGEYRLTDQVSALLRRPRGLTSA